MMIMLSEWARRNGIADATARKKAIKGHFETAQKVGNYWMIDEDEPNVDRRKKENRIFYKNLLDGKRIADFKFKEIENKYIGTVVRVVDYLPGEELLMYELEGNRVLAYEKMAKENIDVLERVSMSDGKVRTIDCRLDDLKNLGFEKDIMSVWRPLDAMEKVECLDGIFYIACEHAAMLEDDGMIECVGYSEIKPSKRDVKWMFDGFKEDLEGSVTYYL